MIIFYYLWPVALLFGLCIGSFLNVCIYRIPIEMKVYEGRSICPCCRSGLHALDLIPVVSYLILRGKCRHCGCRISPVYPIVELLTGLLFVAAFYFYGLSLQTLLVWVLICVLVVASFIDIHTLEIPDGVSIWIVAIGVVSFFVPGLLWWQRLLGSLVAAFPLLIILLVSKGNAMGMGDIKLMAAVGLILGYKLSLFALFSATIFGAVIGLLLILLKKKGKRDEMPFVPMLSFGVLFALFFGNNIISWYLSLLH
jgi:prepilin signal peptidase PulO-like enzyme (type II secretory pathway)